MVMRYAHLQPEVNAKAINAAMSFYPQTAVQTDTKTDSKTDTKPDSKIKSSTKSDTNKIHTRKRLMNIDDL